MVNIFCVFFDAKWATTRVVVHKKVCHVMFSSLVLINHAFHESYFLKKSPFPTKNKTCENTRHCLFYTGEKSCFVVFFQA